MILKNIYPFTVGRKNKKIRQMENNVSPILALSFLNLSITLV